MAGEASMIDAQGAEAIKLYTSLLKSYPDYPRNDQVLYQLARAYETTGQPEKALATLDDVMRRYPRSPQMDEVQFRRGELLFSAKQYQPAQDAYGFVISKGDKSTFLTQSLYKHGWSLFKQGLNDDSLPSFAGVLDRTMLTRQTHKLIPVEKLPRANRELADDTLRVMAITFSYDDDSVAAIDRFLSAPQQPGLRAHPLFAPRRPVRREGALPGRGGRVPRLRHARAEQRVLAGTVDAGHRGLSQGWLHPAGARRQARIRGAVQLRHRRSGTAATRPTTRTSPRSSRPTSRTSRPTSTPTRRSRRSPTSTSRRRAGTAPTSNPSPTIRIPSAPTTCCPKPCYEARDYQGASVEFTRTAYNYPRNAAFRCRGLRRARLVHEVRGEPAGGAEGRGAQGGRGCRHQVRHQLPGTPGQRGRADARRGRRLCHAGPAALDRGRQPRAGAPAAGRCARSAASRTPSSARRIST